MNAEWPKIPDTLKEPIVFKDKNLGIAMLCFLGDTGKQWIFRVHNGHWCSVRMVSPDDPVFVEKLNRPD